VGWVETMTHPKGRHEIASLFPVLESHLYI
jgi:hypothetical protein